MSFVLVHQGYRLETGRGEQTNGHWISNQLSHFKTALKAFQVRTQAPILLADPPAKEMDHSWIRALGFPRQECLSQPIHLPKWQEARDLIASAPHTLCAQDLTQPHAERWRRWVVGIPGSHEHGAVGGDDRPLWDIPLPRIRHKQRGPTWWSQVPEIRRCRAKIAMHPEAQTFWDGKRIVDWLSDRGALNRDGVVGVVSQLRAESKRAQSLRERLPAISEKRWHLPSLWNAKARPKCLICGFVGYSSKAIPSMSVRCMGWDRNMDAGTLPKQLDADLVKDMELAATRAATLLRLVRDLNP